MDEWEDILRRLDDYHAEQNGNPAQLLRIIAELLDESGELYADTLEARYALNGVALRLRNMVCDDDEKLDRSLQQLTDLLSAWDYAESRGLPFPCVNADDLETIREERDSLERALRDREQRICALEEEVAHLQQMRVTPRDHARTTASESLRQSSNTQIHTDRNDIFADPFLEIPRYEVQWLDLSISCMVPVDAPHLGITGTDCGVICSYTFFNLPVLKTLQFQCPIYRIDANAFYHEAELALKFQTGTCTIHPQAFSPGTRITAICAPRGTGPNALENYARTHKIPFIPL